MIDSDILIEVSRARDEVILERWDQLSREDTAIMCSPVTVAEFWHGARPQEHTTLNMVFAAIHCIPIDIKIGLRAGEYLKQYATSHHVELGDALIAATVAIHKLQLWTRNQKHYPMKDVVFY